MAALERVGLAGRVTTAPVSSRADSNSVWPWPGHW